MQIEIGHNLKDMKKGNVGKYLIFILHHPSHFEKFITAFTMQSALRLQ